MSLVATKEIQAEAYAARRAVGAFEVWDMASVQAVISAAEQLDQPVILQLGPGELDYAGIRDLARIGVDHAERAQVPVAVHLDHGESFERVMQCINNRFTSVMLDVSHLPFEENVAATKEVVRVAHACGVSVEGEIGRVGGEEAEIDVQDSDAHLTDPDEAAEYVKLTGVDSLAVGIGNAHGFYKGEPHIRMELLERIAGKVSVPLVLHGGTGIPGDVIRNAISLGIAKVNICTEFVAAFADAFVERQAAADFKYNVQSVFSRAREAGMQVVLEKIRLLAEL